LAPVVVLQLKGTGDQPTSPIQVKGRRLVLLLTPGLRLVPLRKAAGREAFILVEDGSLEIHGGGVRLPDDYPVPLEYLLLVRHGDLTFTGCRLEGPMQRPPERYQGLVRWEPARSAGSKQSRAFLKDCILASVTSCLHLGGQDSRLQMVNCLLVAPDDAFHLDFGKDNLPGATWNIEHTTLAVGGAALYLRDVPGLTATPLPLVFRAAANAFLSPFGERRRAAVLTSDQDALRHGLLLWRGSQNLYDRRLRYYAAAVEGAGGEVQPYAAWARLWGPPGDQQPIADPQFAGRFAAERSPLEQLDRLILPRSPGSVSPGADLAMMGIRGSN
jgi:hypothetical protein